MGLGAVAPPQLSGLRLRRPEGDEATRFPFSVPALRELEELEFSQPVTLFIGENGTGKSTLLESLALAAGLPAVGSASLERDPSLQAQRRMARSLALTWRARSHRGFFLRAEDFFGFQKEVARARVEHQAEIARMDVELADASEYARTLAKGPHRSSIADMERRYGADPDAASHGQAFLRLFGARLAPGGLYLLDEPEAALSPQSQLGFLAMMKEAVDSGSQFIVATHSPLLMAVPGAVLLSFDTQPPRPLAFDEVPSVTLVRDFLAAPERYLRLVWGE